MKTVPELLAQKEREMQKLQAEVEALRVVSRLLNSDAEERAEAARFSGANGNRATAGEHRFP